MRRIKLLLFLLVIGAVLIGCTSEEGSTNNKGNNSDNEVNINETGFPIVDEEITIHMVGRKNPVQADWKDMSILQEYEEMTNIHIDWDTPSGDAYDEKFNLIMGSGDYPEAFFGGDIST